jgi:hypothetical protein
MNTVEQGPEIRFGYLAAAAGVSVQGFAGPKESRKAMIYTGIVLCISPAKAITKKTPRH